MAYRNYRTIGAMSLTIRSRNTANELQTCLDEISNPLFDPTIRRFELSLSCTPITPRILAVLTQILNQPLHKAPKGKGSKWDQVSMSHCTFTRPGMTELVVYDEGFCSQDNIQLFASALARGTVDLSLHECPEILECLFNSPHLELNELSLRQERFSALECASIGNLVQSCVALKDLDISTSHFDEPLIFGQGLANAFHLQSVRFIRNQNTLCPLEATLSDVLVKGGVNSIVGQLLSPPSRLQKLSLDELYLGNDHFLSIVEMLPTSQLQVLDVSYNRIDRQGLLAFAHQLPRIKCLKTIDMYHNPWENHRYDDELVEECIAALLQGMIENYSIERFRLQRGWRMERMNYCTDANRIRNRILATPISIPVGLWPRILERVVTSEWNPTWDEDLKFRNYRPNALFFVLQNCPILSSASMRRRHSASFSTRRSQRKRRSADQYC